MQKSPLAACLKDGQNSRKKAEEFYDFYSDLDQAEAKINEAPKASSTDMQLKDLSESHASMPDVQVACNSSTTKQSNHSPELLSSSHLIQQPPLHSYSAQQKPSAIEKALAIAFKPRTEMTFGDFNELIPKPMQMSAISDSLAESYTLSVS